MTISNTTLTPSAPGGIVAPTYPVGDVTIVVATGHLDSVSFLALNRRVTEALEEGRRHLVLDLQAVDAIDPDALGFLWATLRGVRRTGATLAVAGARPSLVPALKVLDSGGLSIHANSRSARLSAHKSMGTA